jgi:hypothetical protein
MDICILVNLLELGASGWHHHVRNEPNNGGGGLI